MVDGSRLSAFGQALQFELDLREGVCVQQFAEFVLAEQVAQQVPVECERLRAPLSQRRVALVHVRGDVVEEQRRANGDASCVSTAVTRISRLRTCVRIS